MPSIEVKVKIKTSSLRGGNKEEHFQAYSLSPGAQNLWSIESL